MVLFKISLISAEEPLCFSHLLWTDALLNTVNIREDEIEGEVK